MAARVSYLSPEEADALAQHLTSAISLEEETVGDAIFHGAYNVYGIRNAEPGSGGYVSTDLSLTLARAITVWMRNSGWAQAAVRYLH